MTLATIPGIFAYSRPRQLGLSPGGVLISDIDYSGNGHHGTPTGNVTYDALRGALDFDGASYISYNPLANLVFGGTNKPYSWLGLVQLKQIGQTQTYFIAANNSGSGQPTKDFFYRKDSAELLWAASRSDGGVEITSGAGVPDTQMHVMGVGFDGTYSYLWLDGVMVNRQLANVGALDLSVDGGYVEGVHARLGLNTFYLSGFRGERGIWSRYLSNSEWAAGTAYLQSLVPHSLAPAFDPMQIVGCQQWYNPDSLDGSGNFADGDTVTSWAVKGLDYHVSSTLSPITSPTLYVAGVQNGRGGINCNGKFLWPFNLANAGAGFLQAGTPSFSAFGAFKASLSSIEQDLWSVSNTAGSTYFILGVNVGNRYKVVQVNDAGTPVVALGPLADTNFHTWQMTFNGSVVNWWLDGVKIFDDVAMAGGPMAINRYVPTGGLSNGAAHDEAWQHIINESGVFPQKLLTDAEVAQIEAYQHAYWYDAPVPALNLNIVSPLSVALSGGSTLFTIKQGDTRPSLLATLKGADGTATDLTLADSVRFHFQNVGDGTTFDRLATIVSVSAGTVRYDWVAADTVTLGIYVAEFEVTWADGNVTTYANDGNFYVKITAEIA